MTAGKTLEDVSTQTSLSFYITELEEVHRRAGGLQVDLLELRPRSEGKRRPSCSWSGAEVAGPSEAAMEAWPCS